MRQVNECAEVRPQSDFLGDLSAEHLPSAVEVVGKAPVHWVLDRCEALGEGNPVLKKTKNSTPIGIDVVCTIIKDYVRQEFLIFRFLILLPTPSNLLCPSRSLSLSSFFYRPSALFLF